LGAVFFTILLVTGNTISQSVRERTGELGVLKAIGFTNGRVLVLVLLESCLLSVLGGVLGLGIGKLLTAGGDPTGGMLPRFLFTNGDMAIGLGASVALGLVTGVFPAVQAMRLKVADALRRI
jgi:putative ABC transport system permease protein